jgi:UDP-glucose:glycoprotein glucosyltransferase
MDVPTSWLVRPKESVHDLDNLRLEAILSKQDSSVVDIRFELEQLVIEGHGREAKGSVPRGLQLQLATAGGDVVGDTSIMANLGYFQFKASPGLYQLQIREGRGRDVYSISSMTSDQTLGSQSEGSELILASFTGLTVVPAFERRPGMETADVLKEPQVVPGFLSKLKSS